MKTVLALLVVVLVVVLAGGSLAAQQPQEIRVGIIGLDTSHVTAFTKLLNDRNSPEYVPGARVVAGYPGGSPDVPASANRIEKFTAELRDQWKVEIVKDIPTLVSKVDAVLLESVDGRVHLEQVKPVLAAGKPVFIDKPMTASYRDAVEIARLAKQAGVPWWSSSSLRYAPALAELRQVPGGITGAITWGPATLEPTNPGLFWYGIHSVEMLFALMGTGCEEVSSTNTEGADVVTGRWKDGRIGTVRGLRAGRTGYGAVAFGGKAIQMADASKGAHYRALLLEVVKFFQTKLPPVPNDETVEIMAFMEAAERSRKQGGKPVKLAELD